MTTLEEVRRPVRGTQSLVHTLGRCWSRPSLLAMEVAWRWGFGIPALAMLYVEGGRVLARAPLASTGIYDLSLAEPFRAAVIVSDTWAVLEQPLFAVAAWLLPLLAVGWAVASGLGRGLVLRRLEPGLPVRPGTLIALQLLRLAALGITLAAWFGGVRRAAAATLGTGDTEPNLVGYFAVVICLSLGLFTLWALVSWVFSIAPLVALLEDRGAVGSLVRSLRLGPLTGKLVEVNMVLGIVKLALVVLAMVFSATPLPFSTVMTGAPLYCWWAGVAVLYLLASDYFQVARLAAFVEFWQHFHRATTEVEFTESERRS